MVHLTLAGTSDDGEHLRLVDEAGTEYTLGIDAKLRAALRGDPARPGQMETTMDSSLRPRDIQARIRAGETPESVAAAAGTTVERIMPFAGPVLAEREHVAARAQRSSVRRRAGEPGGTARTLGDAVAAALRPHHVAPDRVRWDAWRRDDGRWVLTGSFETPARSGAAQFAFDMPGNYVLCENDDARWLVGEQIDSPAVEPPRDDLQARRRRLAAVDEEELPLGDDALELVQPSDPSPEPVIAPTAEAEPEPEERPQEQPQSEEPAPRRPVRKSRGRASVPSWDEIMFGGGKQEQ